MSTHITLHGMLSGLRGWGTVASGSRSVMVVLRDPGEVAVIQPRTLRHRDLFVLPITRVEILVDDAQRSRGGGWVGGGFGVSGALRGAAVAGMLNRASYERWEETYLHLTETLRNGAQRAVTITLPTHTTSSLRDVLTPARDAWAREWADQVLKGAISAFEPELTDLDARYAQLDSMVKRRVLSPENARLMSAQTTQPLLDTLHHQLTLSTTTHDEARQILDRVDALHAGGRVIDTQVEFIRRIAESIPTPEVAGRQAAQNDQALEHLRRMREIGAITQTQLDRESARLR